MLSARPDFDLMLFSSFLSSNLHGRKVIATKEPDYVSVKETDISVLILTAQFPSTLYQGTEKPLLHHHHHHPSMEEKLNGRCVNGRKCVAEERID